MLKWLFVHYELEKLANIALEVLDEFENGYFEVSNSEKKFFIGKPLHGSLINSQ